MRPLAFLLLAPLAALACAPEWPSETLLAPDADADAALGARGPFGARVTRRTLDPRDGCAVDADVYTPWSDDDDPCPCEPFLFVQGGAVALERYRWLGAHLASRGLVVAAATHPFDLALFAVDHTARALGGLRAASEDPDDPLAHMVTDSPAIVAGHSLGGVVAAKSWGQSAPADIRHLVLLASFPQQGDPLGDRAGRVLSIVGDEDERSDVDEVVHGARAFDDAQVIVIDGMNHYQWTDDPTDGELASDGPGSVSTSAARARALAFIDALVEDLRGRSYYPFDDEAAWPEGTHAP